MCSERGGGESTLSLSPICSAFNVASVTDREWRTMTSTNWYYILPTCKRHGRHGIRGITRKVCPVTPVCSRCWRSFTSIGRLGIILSHFRGFELNRVMRIFQCIFEEEPTSNSLIISFISLAASFAVTSPEVTLAPVSLCTTSFIFLKERCFSKTLFCPSVFLKRLSSLMKRDWFDAALCYSMSRVLPS